nr:uncharacterized protein LOC117687758 isoform X2 [Crassostrea gigas]XP_034320744.1 uncharacterized protein LOC117687758 isoform X2 [Crassostrea gigas]XP_034320746.1 uncharacterized protein LOC105327071 isoform X2 [Crassostrea gigas]
MSTTTTTPTVATSGKLDTTKTPDMLKSSRSKTPEKEKKAVSIDNKLENRLTMKDLAKLQKAFMIAVHDGYSHGISLGL